VYLKFDMKGKAYIMSAYEKNNSII
jgi:hypothetical protein